MNYELAKQLKDAGFPQKGTSYFYFDTEGRQRNVETIYEFDCYIPTLSELMEACSGEYGQRFRWLGFYKNYWEAQARPMHSKSKEYPDSPIPRGSMQKDFKVTGTTPEEAVAKLWLAINKK